MKKTHKLACLALVCSWFVISSSAFAQKDPGVRGGLQNTGGGLQQQGIPIPHPPLISRNPTNGATVNENELASFEEGIIRAGQLESTCDECADVTDGSPVTGMGELDPMFPQSHTGREKLHKYYPPRGADFQQSLRRKWREARGHAPDCGLKRPAFL